MELVFAEVSHSHRGFHAHDDRALDVDQVNVCGRKPSDAHHLRFAQPRALGRKVSDEFTVPLCREHHGELHRRSDDARWWKDAGIDAIATARDLWAQTRSSGPAPYSPSREPDVLNKTMNS
jgi:hypothetical protein